MFLELIIGPMFSGKTTELIEDYLNINQLKKCLSLDIN